MVEVAASGHRNGYRTEATFRVVRPDARPITLTLTIVVDPTAHLIGGRWEEPGLGGGKVTPARLEFLGGQGEGASVGGRYLLEGEGGPRYRVTLPTTLLREGWGPRSLSDFGPIYCGKADLGPDRAPFFVA